jgi:hypothetical protein
MLITASGFVFSQEAPLKFSDNVQKFGKVDEGTDVVLKYTFMNEGSEPILINEAKVNCTCTEVEYPETPVSPNKVGQIIVTFHTESKIGYQERKIQLITNQGNSEISFKGVVKATSETKSEFKSNH